MVSRLVQHSQAINAAFRHADGPKAAVAIPDDALATMTQLLPVLEVFNDVTAALGQERKSTVSQLVFFIQTLHDACKAAEGDDDLVKRFKEALLDGLGAVRTLLHDAP